MLKKLSGILLLLATVFLLAVFHFKNFKVTDNDSILIAAAGLPQLDGEVNTFDPSTGGFLPNVYEGLVRFKRENCQIEPCLATRWRLSPDGLTWTFEIRPNVHFHNGRSLDAALVKAAFERKLSSAARVPYASYLFGMIESISSPDSQHISFQLKYPYTPFLHNLALPQAAVFLPGNPPVGTGPFRIETVKKNEVVLQAFAGYWDRRPIIGTVCIRAAPDVNKRIRLLQKEAGVIALNIPPAKARRLPPGTVRRCTAISLSYLGFYTSRPPFDNPAARRAVALAVNRHRLCQVLYGGFITEAKRILPPGVLSSQPDFSSLKPNINAARNLVHATGLKGRTVTLLTYKGIRPYNPASGERLAEELKHQLENAGLRIKVRSYRWKELKAAIARQEGDIFLFGWVSDNGDPDNFLYCLLGGSQVATGFNTTRYNNPALDLLLSRAQQIPDSPVRMRVYRHVEAVVNRELPLITLNYGEHIAAAGPEIKGFTLHPLGTYDLRKLKRSNVQRINFH